MKSITLFMLALLFTALVFVRSAEVEDEVEDEFEVEIEEEAETEIQTVPTGAIVRAPANYANYVTWHSEKVPAAGFEVQFFAKASNDIHVVFMCQQQQRSPSAWEIVIGGSRNTKSSIRLGTQGRELVAAFGSPCTANVFESYTIVYSSGTMVVKDGDKTLMTARMPVPACSSIFVGLGAWDREVFFQGFSTRALAPAPTTAPATAPTTAPTAAPTTAVISAPVAPCPWRLNDGFDMRGTPVCKPGYTNLHPENPNLRGRCLAQLEEAQAWCSADPNCDGVQCTAWSSPDEGCEPVSTKGSTGVVDPIFGHKSAFICARPTPAPPAPCNLRLNDGFDMRGTPVCKPGYTNLHPENPNLRGRCLAQLEEAQAWCSADPNCDGVQCTAWSAPDEGCEPVSTKGSTGVVDPVFGHKSAFYCDRTRTAGVQYFN